MIVLVWKSVVLSPTQVGQNRSMDSPLRLLRAPTLTEIGRQGIGTKCALYEHTEVSISSEAKKRTGGFTS